MGYMQRVKAAIASACAAPMSYGMNFLKHICNRGSLCLYGLGSHGNNWYQYLTARGIPIQYFFDQSENRERDFFQLYTPPPRGQMLSYDELYSLKEDVAVLVAIRNATEVVDKLQEDGFSNIYIAPIDLFCLDANVRYIGQTTKLEKMQANILRLLDICADDASRRIVVETVEKWLCKPETMLPYTGDQYFPKEIIHILPHEVFVDVGAYDGDTIDEFVERTGGSYDSIFAWEMDQRNFRGLHDRFMHHPQISVFPYGAWDSEGEASYNSNGSSSCFCEGGAYTTELKRVDDILGNEKVTYIKMDIEGAEMRALRGAEQVILKNHPKLAICTYHLAEHLWEVPFYIISLSSEYRIYFRHHSHDECETVCYAVV